jgi:predicted small metal-binding protein
MLQAPYCHVSLSLQGLACSSPSEIQEADMARLFVDCRDYPSEKNCTVAISADSKEELVDAAAQHAVAVHGHHDTPELRQELAKMIKPAAHAEGLKTRP